MEANELRIGNYFVGYSNYVQQWEIESFVLLSKGVEVDEIIRSFIPLTEEWLLKFGFKKELDLFWRKDKSQIIEILFYDNGINVTTQSICINHIKYVHQLQNLYFSLIGKELKLC